MPTTQQPKSRGIDLKVRFLITGMLISGVCNTILNKFQDMQCIRNCNDPEGGKPEYFEQPVFQTFNMFIGETFCMVLVYSGFLWSYFSPPQQSSASTADEEREIAPSAIGQLDAAAVVDDVEDVNKRDESNLEELAGWKELLFWVPTLCDLTATTLMNIGLVYTAASVYQMLRGAVVIFTGVFSWFFLNRRMRLYEWVSLFLVVFGVSIVGLSSVLFPQQQKPSGFLTDGDDDPFDWEAAIGIALVLGAQIFTATQFVLEEKIMARYHVKPLRAVGLEGSFGLISVLAAMPLLYIFIGSSHPGGYFDVPETWRQVVTFPQVWGTGIAIAFSIAFFNFFGLSVTSTVSATSRSTIDTCRTVFIWMVSLMLGWERFSWIQVLGFIILVAGTLIYNGAFPYFQPKHGEHGETAPLLADDNTIRGE